MATRYIYSGSFTNREGEEILVEIHDRDADIDNGDNIVEQSITFYAPALILETYNTSENEFNSIIGTRAFFQIRSTNEVNFATFAEGRDQRWFIRASYDTETKFIFSGFIDMDDNLRPFLPHGQPFTISATDNLGALKDIPLTDFDNAVPDFTSKQKIITVIQWCLHKTGLRDLFDRLIVVNNLFEENHEDRSVADSRCALNQTYVNIIDFCKSPNEFLDCHTVLNRILFSWGMRVCQYNNNWYIFRIDEYRNGLLFDLTTYFTGGVPESGTIGTGFGKLLDSDDIDLVKAESVERIRRPYRECLIKKDYSFPPEILRNSTFVRGAVDDDVLPLKTFQIDDWELRRGFGSAADTPNCEARIWRRYNAAGYETERYAVLTPAATHLGEQNYIISTDIRICELDKISFSFDYSADSDNSSPGPETLNIAGIELEGDDGSFWILGDNINASGDDQVPEWKLSDAQHSTNNDLYRWFLDDSEDFTEWRSYSIESPPAPTTGVLRVFFFAANQVSGAIDDFAIRYNNVRFTYTPLVAGSYKELDGEQYRMYQTDTITDYSRTFEEDYHLFDPPCLSFKGALMYEDTGDYFGTSLWFDRAAETYAPSTIPTSMVNGERFLRWQMFAIWNQIRRSRRIFQYSLFGLDTGNGHAGIIHQYTIQNAGLPINALYFLILSMRQNWHDCTWTATMMEVNYITERRAEGTFEFKYLEDN